MVGRGCYSVFLCGASAAASATCCAYHSPPQHDANLLPLPAPTVQVGAAVEAAFGGRPQDIEGALIMEGESAKIFIVQSRPQVVGRAGEA